MVVGGGDSKSLVYKFNTGTSRFELNETINHSSSDVNYVDITEDHNLLIITRSTLGKIEVYKHDGTSYQLSETLSQSLSAVEWARMSGDGKYIIYGNLDRQIYVFENAGSNYELVQYFDFGT